ncbi:aminoglycoside phosphotransferase family protein [Deinococcus sonorensis]|uniref:Aminoglycoside phosphotransferase family protein n=2 Tax=Deinococcus sonorensis TaxID=309891 RepID=A0AAU7U9F4_9DEIO
MLEVGEHIGWDHGEAQVYAACWQGRPAVLKRHRQPHKFARELYGYRTWPAHLPQLLHSVPERLELVLERRPGECALLVSPTPDLYWAAGAALRVLHDAAPLAIPFDTGRHDLERLMNAFVPRAASWIDPAQVQRVEAMTRAALSGPFPAVVLRHGDYTARNWLWDGSRLTVIDVEHARPGPAVLDTAKLLNALPDPALAQAFQSGYGRGWTAEEHALLRAVRCFDALALAVWCAEHTDRAGYEQSTATLTGLLSSAVS